MCSTHSMNFRCSGLVSDVPDQSTMHELNLATDTLANMCEKMVADLVHEEHCDAKFENPIHPRNCNNKTNFTRRPNYQ